MLHLFLSFCFKKKKFDESCYLALGNYLQIGPLRCWPGGLCLSRSIGDMDVGEFIVPIPHVKQVKVFVFFFIYFYLFGLVFICSMFSFI